MGKLQNNEQGFSAVEIVLVVIIVALIGTVGWLVYENHHKTNTVSTTNTSTNKPTSTPTPTKSTPKISTKQQSTAADTAICTTDTTNAQGGVYGPTITVQNDYLQLAAVSLKVPVSSNLNDLLSVCVPPYNDGSTAAAHSPLVTTYLFSTTTLEQDSSSCTPTNSNSLGGLEVLSSNNSNFGAYIGHVGKYYLYYSSPQNSCYGSGPPPASFSTLQHQEAQALQAALKNTTSD